MENNVNFKIIDFNSNSKNIINSKLLIHKNNSEMTFKIINFLGKGTVGQVYLLEPNSSSNENYVVKISNSECQDDLKREVKKVIKYFTEGNIKHKAYPKYFGNFDNLNAYGVIYPYLGFYNLDKIKSIKYHISWTYNIMIIKQLIKQVNSFTTIIHGDLKPPNVVINVTDTIEATIIDFGLIKKKNDKYGIISTNYVSSPESVLSLEEYNKFKEKEESIDYSKHDYFGLFCVIVNLFVKNSYWSILSKYITDVFKVSNNFLLNHEAVLLFTYAWYRFFYKNIDQLPNQSLKNLIIDIETKSVKSSFRDKFLSWDAFFDKYVIESIDKTSFNFNYLELFRDFLKKLIHFDSSKRTDLDELLNHQFLN
jgi:serine/threonine protein kinase